MNNPTTIILYYSKHHGNTLKLLKAIKEFDQDVLLIDVTKATEIDLNDFDRIGIASGIYFGSFAKQVIKYCEENLPMHKQVFYIYTHGAPIGGFLKSIRKIIKKKECQEIGKYHSLGYDTFGPFKLIGGLAKKHPNEKDIKGATIFYQRLIINITNNN